MPRPDPRISPPHPHGFALPAVLVIVSALLILVMGMLLIVGTERNTARAFVDHQRANLAARAALEDVKGILTRHAANDTFAIIQSTLKNPLKEGFTPSPFLFLAEGQKGDSDGFTHRYLPLFSTPSPPPTTARLEAPDLETITPTSDDPASTITLSPLPYLDPVRLTWIPLRNENNQVVARYAFWVEDLQGKIDPKIAGNLKAQGETHLTAEFPFPAPGVNPLPASASEPALSAIPLHVLDPETNPEKPGPLARLLINRRPTMISPESLMAAANLTPPLTRDPFGRLTNPTGKTIEENLITSVQPYLEQPRIPYAQGISANAAGQPKLNLNALLAKGPQGVDEMADLIADALPEFTKRQGAFPEDYLRTLAANALDYADADSNSTLEPGSHRGIDSFPMLSEISLQIRYVGMQTINNRRILNWQFRLFAELWNMTTSEASGTTRLSYEVALPMEGIGAGTSSRRFDDPAILNNPERATHQLTRIGDKFWSPEIQVTLKPNEYKTYEFANVTYKLDVGPSSINVASKFSLTEQEGASGASLMWNNQEIDRAEGIIRQKNGLEFEISKPSYRSKATVISLALGPYGSEVDCLGDPRTSLYLRDTAHAENASPENTSPNRRNIRRATIYDSDSARKPKTYGRTLPSEWPDGGQDAPVGSWTISKDDAVIPTDPMYNWSQNPQAAHAPQRLSNLGRFYSVTELGRIYDPIMWLPTYDSTADTTTIRNGLMPPSRSAWPDTLTTSPPSPNHGGGNTLRIGRPEHPAFNLPGRRASHLLDLFHTGQARSDNPTLREANLALIRGHVNLNTASRDALRTLAAGPLRQDPLIGTASASGSHQGAPIMAPPVTKASFQAPSTDPKKEADRIADAIIRARPFASPSELAHVRDTENRPVFGNPELYQNSGQLPANTRLRWTDAAAEEMFARMFEASTVRSRNFRVWVIGQALAPSLNTNRANNSTNTSTPPTVLAEVRKVYTLFADPGERNDDDSINPKSFRPTVIHERDF